MAYHNINRARESDDHRRMKDEARSILLESGYPAVYPERKCCDLVAVRLAGPSVVSLAVEVERSPRNVVRNAQRNFENGCDATLILSSNTTVYDSCVRTLRKRLAVDLVEKTFINTFPQFRYLRRAFILSSAPLYSDFIRQRTPLYSSAKDTLFAAAALYSLPIDVDQFAREEKG